MGRAWISSSTILFNSSASTLCAGPLSGATGAIFGRPVCASSARLESTDNPSVTGEARLARHLLVRRFSAIVQSHVENFDFPLNPLSPSNALRNVSWARSSASSLLGSSFSRAL